MVISASFTLLTAPTLATYHVELTAIRSDLGVKPVEVLEFADVALHAGDVPADRGDGFV
jgi:hypothetical protein